MCDNDANFRDNRVRSHHERTRVARERGHRGEPPSTAAALRPGRRQLIIRRHRLDDAPRSPTKRAPSAWGRVALPVDAWPMAAMQDPIPAFERHSPLDDDTASISELLADLRGGSHEAFEKMLPLLYDDLRRAASRELAVRPSDTLSTTALVHELYLKFSRSTRTDWQDRAHFLAVAGVAMRHILVDHARRRTADKRGGRLRHVTLDDGLVGTDGQAESLLELHDALAQLARLDKRLARVVECRFFGGMTEQETAEVLHVTERTVRRDWIKARGLLYQALGANMTRELAIPGQPPAR